MERGAFLDKRVGFGTSIIGGGERDGSGALSRDARRIDINLTRLRLAVPGVCVCVCVCFFFFFLVIGFFLGVRWGCSSDVWDGVVLLGVGASQGCMWRVLFLYEVIVALLQLLWSPLA